MDRKYNDTNQKKDICNNIIIAYFDQLPDIHKMPERGQKMPKWPIQNRRYDFRFEEQKIPAK